MPKHQHKPQSRPHPGETLREKLQEMGMGPKEFAIRTCKPEKTIIAVLNGESSLTPDMAVAFETVTRIPASFWMNHQCAYDENLARAKQVSIVEASREWAKQFPLTEMIKKGWLPRRTSMHDKTLTLLAFFGIAGHTAWSKYYCEQQLKAAFGISIHAIQHAHAVSAWMRQGELQANELVTHEFSAKALRSALPKLKSLAKQRTNVSFDRLQALAGEAGLKIIRTPMLHHNKVIGVTRWINGNPLIQIADVTKRNGDQWLTFFHQVGHVLLHGKKGVFLENIEYADMDQQKESEADDFAMDWMP
jgi:addiction module HigA family antidote